MNSVIVMWPERRMIDAPPKNETQTIISSQASVVAARSWPAACAQTLKNTSPIINPAAITRTQSTTLAR